MEYSELIAARYSVRAYRPDPVEDEKLQTVLEAARLAPTAHNLQPIQLVVMRTAGREEERAEPQREERDACELAVEWSDHHSSILAGPRGRVQQTCGIGATPGGCSVCAGPRAASPRRGRV